MDDLFQVQPCILCSGATERRLTELTFEFDGVTIVITGVPVAVCSECGEEYIPGPLAVLIGDEVDKLAKQLRSMVENTNAIDKRVAFKASLSQSGITLGDQSLVWATA